jgi:tetratricopeptide (TPR) repeat protein
MNNLHASVAELDEAGQARYRAACAARDDGRLEIALYEFNQILDARPNHGAALLGIGTVQLMVGELKAAENALTAAVKVMFREPEVWRGLVSVFRGTSRIGDERHCLEQLLTLEPADRPTLSRLLEIYTRQGNVAERLRILESIEAIESDTWVKLEKAVTLVAAGNNAAAQKIYLELARSPSCTHQTVAAWVKSRATGYSPQETYDILQSAIADNPSAFALWTALGGICTVLGRYDEALSANRKAVELNPDAIHAWYGMSVVQMQLGDMEGATRAQEECLRIDPDNAFALRLRYRDHKYQYGDEPFRRLNKLAAESEVMAVEARIQMHYAIAKAYEDVGDIDTAFAHYRQGGRLLSAITPYNHAANVSLLKLFKSHLTPQRIVDFAKNGDPSNKPVFVVGMPRSGSTLIEQILSSHPQVHGGGELKLLDRILNGFAVDGVTYKTLPPDVGGSIFPTSIIPDNTAGMSSAERGKRYVQALDHLSGGQHARVVDKMLGNFRWAGLIAMALPNAKIIHSRRHPMEMCLSAYRILFADTLSFTYTLEDLGKSYRLYHEYMAFWRETLPAGTMIEIRYEDVVENTEREARKIVEHVGLEWDDACLRFYENERPVSTASLMQVRKPIYRDATNRWRKYERHLGPLLDQIGDLVADYEAELEQASGTAAGA